MINNTQSPNSLYPQPQSSPEKLSLNILQRRPNSSHRRLTVSRLKQKGILIQKNRLNSNGSNNDNGQLQSYIHSPINHKASNNTEQAQLEASEATKQSITIATSQIALIAPFQESFVEQQGLITRKLNQRGNNRAIDYIRRNKPNILKVDHKEQAEFQQQRRETDIRVEGAKREEINAPNHYNENQNDKQMNIKTTKEYRIRHMVQRDNSIEPQQQAYDLTHNAHNIRNDGSLNIYFTTNHVADTYTPKIGRIRPISNYSLKKDIRSSQVIHKTPIQAIVQRQHVQSLLGLRNNNHTAAITNNHRQMDSNMSSHSNMFATANHRPQSHYRPIRNVSQLPNIHPENNSPL